MPYSVKSVIFDIDNTLYDFAYYNGIALDKLREYAHENFAWTAETFDEKHLAVQHEIYSQIGYNGSCRDRMLRYQKMLEHSSLPLFPHAAKMFELYWSTMLENLQPYNGVREVLEALKERELIIGIGSDMTPYIQVKKLEKMNVLQFIDFIVTSEEAGDEKPSPKVFQMCLDKAGCSKSECLFVGDDLKKDYEGAGNFGMRALLMNPHNKELSNDIQQITSLTQILEMIN
ncbi:MAG: HAD family hydrolase [Synergistaceae bacterium]|nr:HAD family hydrolase [Synergistaceae bacterium]